MKDPAGGLGRLVPELVGTKGLGRAQEGRDRRQAPSPTERRRGGARRAGTAPNSTTRRRPETVRRHRPGRSGDRQDVPAADGCDAARRCRWSSGAGWTPATGPGVGSARHGRQHRRPAAGDRRRGRRLPHRGRAAAGLSASGARCADAAGAGPAVAAGAHGRRRLHRRPTRTPGRYGTSPAPQGGRRRHALLEQISDRNGNRITFEYDAATAPRRRIVHSRRLPPETHHRRRPRHRPAPGRSRRGRRRSGAQALRLHATAT